MGVYIKGMKMPTNCHECEFVDILPTCPCNQIADEDFWNNVSLAVEGHKDCPLVPVPPHGRLIDADALLQEFYKAQKSYHAHGRPFSDAFMSGNEICAEWWAVERKVEDAQTIIPAEEEKT